MNAEARPHSRPGGARESAGVGGQGASGLVAGAVGPPMVDIPDEGGA